MHNSPRVSQPSRMIPFILYSIDRRSRSLFILLFISKVKIIIVHFVFGNVVRSEDVPNVESELHDCVAHLVLHLVCSDVLEDAARHSSPDQGECHGDQHGRSLVPSLLAAAPDQLWVLSRVRQRKYLVQTLLLPGVELVVLLRHGDPGQEDGEEPTQHGRHPVEVVDPASVGYLQSLHQEGLDI